MSLLVWLPMTKDLSDQGLGGCTITNDGATLDNNGKLGKCYNFDGANDRIQVSGLNNPKNITVAFWMKRNATTGTRQFLFTAWGGVSIELGTANNLFGKVSTSGGEAGGASGGTVTADSGWIHVCYTFEDKVGGKMYINGVLTGSGDTTSSIAWTTTSGYIGNYSNIYLNAKLNDFRIYDSCLSPKEIEILSRGLVCHYPLNGGGRGGDNICTWGYSQSPRFANGAGTTKLTDTDYGEYRRYTCTTAGTSGGRYGYPVGQTGALVQGNVYTWSADFRANKQLSFTSSSYIGMEGGGTLAGSDIKIGTEWRRLSKTWTQGSSQAFILYPKDSIALNDWIDIRNFKIEVGDKSTPYIPSSSESAYTAMGYNSTTEYDASGYGYNGTKNGTIAYSNDTARYSVSTTFNGSNTYIEADPLPSETATIACWLKTPWAYVSGAYQLVIHDKNTGLAIGWSGSNMITYVGSGNGGTGSYLNTSGIWQANKWMHVVVVKTGSTTRDIYINGVKQSPSGVNYWGGDLNKLNIGNRHISGSYSTYFNGQISDFRAYATALSATQVAELYNTAVSVANNGTLMGYELVEG